MSDQTPIDWARPLVTDRAWVIHVKSGTVGRVARYYDGEGRVYEPRVEAAEAFEMRLRPMIELDGGESFEASRDQFVRLSESEARFYNAAIDGVKGFVSELARFAVSAGLGQTLFEHLVSAAMRGQLTALEHGKSSAARDTIPTDRPPGIAPGHERPKADDA